MADRASTSLRRLIGVHKPLEWCACAEPFVQEDDPAEDDDDELGYCWRCRRPIRNDEDDE